MSSDSNPTLSESRTTSPVARGKLIILSGPSGSGKSTVISKALENHSLPVRLAISATTRKARPGEIDGKHYHFCEKEAFEASIASDKFLEWADVYGFRYGTLREEVDPHLEKGTSVLLEIDVQGGMQIYKKKPDCVLVFIRASTPKEYERRLRARKTDDPASLEKRLKSALHEIEIGSCHYHYQVINDDLEQAVTDFHRLLSTLTRG